MKTDNRTEKQKWAYFLFQDFVAEEMNKQGRTMEALVSEVRPRPTKTALHEVFKEILYKMYWKTTTNDMTREELNNCLDVYLEALAHSDIQIDFPDNDRKTLLSSYS